MTVPTVTVRLAGRVEPVGSGQVSTRPGGPEPGTGGLEVPGITPPDRPQLDVTCAAAGVAGLVMAPESAAGPGVLFRSAEAVAIPLPVGTRAVAAAADGLWASSGERVLEVDPDGRVRAEIEVPATRLVGSLGTSGAVWALTPDAAWFIAADRTVVRHPATWPDPVSVVATGDRLAGWDRDSPDELVVLAPDGALERTPAPAVREPFERLLAYDGATSLHVSLRSLRRAGPGAGTLDVVGCGLGSTGPFLAARAGDHAWLWTSGPVARLELVGAERVLAVDDDRVLVATRTHARWIDLADDGAATDPDALDATTYRQQIRPVAWEMPTGYGVAACSPQRLVLTSAGPTGLVALLVDWA